MRDQWASFLAGLVRHPIFLIIQPNTAHGAPILASTALGLESPEQQMWALVDTLLYRVDRQRTGGPKPNLLGPADRLQGYVVLEKRQINIHAHFLISCRDTWDQFWTGLSLFDLLDTVPGKDADPSDAWRREAWAVLEDKGWFSEYPRTRTFSPMLNRLASGGTAMVQLGGRSTT